MELTEEEKKFIQEQGIYESLFYDMEGKPWSKELEEYMKNNGKVFAYNTTPCEKNGHTLITRAGHCIQCDTTKIALILKNVVFGCLYIAGSVRGSLIKIGIAKNTEKRADLLKKTTGGKYNDWEVLFTCKCIESIACEKEVHRLLKSYSADATYSQGSEPQEAYDLFRCSYDKARDAVNAMKEKKGIELIDIFERRNRILDYNFRNLKKA